MHYPRNIVIQKRFPVSVRSKVRVSFIVRVRFQLGLWLGLGLGLVKNDNRSFF